MSHQYHEQNIIQRIKSTDCNSTPYYICGNIFTNLNTYRKKVGDTYYIDIKIWNKGNKFIRSIYIYIVLF